MVFIEQLQRRLSRLANDCFIAEQQPVEGGTAYSLTGHSKPFHLRITTGRERRFLIVNYDGSIPCDCSRFVGSCTSLARRNGFGTLLWRGRAERDILVGHMFLRQYYFRLRSQRTLSFEDVLEGDVLSHWQSEFGRLIDLPVRFQYTLSHRPYIHSVAYYTDEKDKDGEPLFHYYLHFHEITRSIYVEKIVVPANLRGQGVGSYVVAELKRMGREHGFRRIYLEAKREAERFWESKGFTCVYRCNLRKQKRRERMLRKEPGWHRVTRVEGRRLQQPAWKFVNHPQDDIDLSLALSPDERSALIKRVGEKVGKPTVSEESKRSSREQRRTELEAAFAAL